MAMKGICPACRKETWVNEKPDYQVMYFHDDESGNLCRGTGQFTHEITQGEEYTPYDGPLGIFEDMFGEEK